MGLLLVAAIVSGIVIYAPFMRRFDFGTIRHRQSPRATWLDLHNLMGAVTIVWLLVVGFTGDHEHAGDSACTICGVDRRLPVCSSPIRATGGDGLGDR